MNGLTLFAGRCAKSRIGITAALASAALSLVATRAGAEWVDNIAPYRTDIKESWQWNDGRRHSS